MGDGARRPAEPVVGSCSDTHALRALHRVSSPTHHTKTDTCAHYEPLFIAKKRRVVRPVGLHLKRSPSGPYLSASKRLCYCKAGGSETLPGHVCDTTTIRNPYIGSIVGDPQWVIAPILGDNTKQIDLD